MSWLSFVCLALLLASSALSSAPAHAGESRRLVSPPRVRPSPLDDLTADGRPTPAAIAVLRSHARGRLARVWVGDTPLVIRRVRFDSLGITFVADPRRAEGLDSDPMTSRDSTSHGSTSHDSTGPPSGPISIPWTAIDGFETRRSNEIPGVLVGAYLMTIVGSTVASAAGPDPGPGILIALALPPAGAVLGRLVGAAFKRWQHEWPPASPPPATTR